MRTIVQLFTIVFASAVVFGLIARPAVIEKTLNSVSGLVTATRGTR